MKKLFLVYALFGMALMQISSSACAMDVGDELPMNVFVNSYSAIIDQIHTLRESINNATDQLMLLVMTSSEFEQEKVLSEIEQLREELNNLINHIREDLERDFTEDERIILGID